jgi:hypothetical protein
MPVPVPLRIPRLLFVVRYKLDVRLTGKAFVVGQRVALGTWLNHHMRLVQVKHPLPENLPDPIPDPLPAPIPDQMPDQMPDTMPDPLHDPMHDSIIWDVT